MLAAFVYTPVFLIGILSIIPVLGYLSILGLLYGLYILYLGLPILQNTPKDKTVIYTIAVLVVSIHRHRNHLLDNRRLRRSRPAVRKPPVE